MTKIQLPYHPILVITDRAEAYIVACKNQGFLGFSGKAEDICSSLRSFQRADLDKPFVVGDISPLVAGWDVEQRLLKVLEEMEPPAVFVSSTDSFSEVILSRFVSVTKRVTLQDAGKICSKENLKEYLLKGDGTFYDGLGVAIKGFYSYLPLFMKYRSSRLPVKKKVLELL